ncbi:MAG: SlyX family protein [Proteobacteria bacterium]|nr:SlyX family protein [Pseudomonadota bacterium]
MPDDRDNRIEALEFKVAHLEQALQDLSDALYRQQMRLDGSEARLKQFAARLDADAPAATQNRFEVPPHY